jgi:tetratricopeptide (TPR) repeat protein
MIASIRSALSRSLFAAFILAGIGAGPALAVSGGGSSSAPVVVCKKGYVYSAEKKVCVRVSSGLIDDQQLYEQGRALALAGHYDQALAALEAIADQNDSMVLTMIGYSKRKSGNWDEGMDYYRRALALNPLNVNAREYLGEAYAEKGRLDLARAELVEIGAIAGTTSEQYLDLATAIAGAARD